MRESLSSPNCLSSNPRGGDRGESTVNVGPNCGESCRFIDMGRLCRCIPGETSVAATWRGSSGWTGLFNEGSSSGAVTADDDLVCERFSKCERSEETGLYT